MWLVILAEILALVWFIVYGFMLEEFSQERASPAKKHDVAEQHFLGHIRVAICLGIGTLVTLTLWEVYA